MMTKQDFIALADMIIEANSRYSDVGFEVRQIEKLAKFCDQRNSRFNRARWVGYITGQCGPNGGKVGRIRW